MVLAPNLGPSQSVPIINRGMSRQIPDKPMGKLNRWCKMMAMPYTPPGASFNGDTKITYPMDIMKVPKTISE